MRNEAKGSTTLWQKLRLLLLSQWYGARIYNIKNVANSHFSPFSVFPRLFRSSARDSYCYSAILDRDRSYISGEKSFITDVHNVPDHRIVLHEDTCRPNQRRRLRKYGAHLELKAGIKAKFKGSLIRIAS